MTKEELQKHLDFFNITAEDVNHKHYLSVHGKTKKIKIEASSKLQNAINSARNYLNTYKELYKLICDDFTPTRASNIFRDSYFEGNVRDIIVLLKTEIEKHND